MIGTNATTGKPLSGIDHLRQSIADILSTPIGSRVMRREYGSELFRLVDRPATSGFFVQLYAATVEALSTWEPRIKVTSVLAEHESSGHVSLTIEGRYLPEGKPVKLEGIVL